MALNVCRHLHHKGPYSGRRCGEKVSKLDPENRYCAKHRMCTFLVKDKVVKPEKEPHKFINYLTFAASVISDEHELCEVEALFNN